MNARSNAQETQTEPVRTALVVHGDGDTRALYRTMLERLGWAVHESEDGADALGKAVTLVPDAMIVSARLARIDGLALCRVLRTDRETRAMGIILLTTTGQPAERVQASASGADVALCPPCTPEALDAALRQATDPGRRQTPTSEPARVEAPPPARRRPRARMIRREQTTTPPLTPPALRCPSCEAHLMYQHSQTGGVNESSFEQWDYFRCHACGPYQYRHRTRKLRAT